MTQTTSLIEQLFAAADGHRYDEVASLLDDDAEMTSPMGDRLSPAAWIEVNRTFAVAVPDGGHTLRSVLEDGHCWAIEGVWTGTQTGPLPTPGGELPPTGRAVTLPFCGIATRRGDRIAQVTIYFDQMSMLAQLGLVPEPAASH